MKKMFLLALSATMLVGCYTQNELDEHKETYELLAVQVQNQANAAIEAANERIAEVEAALDAANINISDLEGAISDLNDEKSLVEAALADSETKNAGLETALEELNATIADLEDMIASLEAENAELKDKISDLERLVQALRDSQVVNVTEVVEVIQQVTEVIGFTQAQVDAAVDAAVADVPTSTVTVTISDGSAITQADLDTAEAAAAAAQEAAAAALITAEGRLDDLIIAQGDVTALQGILNDVKALQASFDVQDSDLSQAIADFIAGLELQIANASSGDDYWTYSDWSPAEGDGSAPTFEQTRTASLTIIGDVQDEVAPAQEALTQTVADTNYVAPVVDNDGDGENSDTDPNDDDADIYTGSDSDDVWTISTSGLGGELLSTSDSSSAVYLFNGQNYVSLAAVTDAVNAANPGVDIDVDVTGTLTDATIEVYADTYDEETLTVNGQPDVAGTATGDIRRVNQASIPDGIDSTSTATSAVIEVRNAPAPNGVDTYTYSEWSPATAASDVEFIDQTRTATLNVVDAADVPAPVAEATSRTINNPNYTAPSGFNFSNTIRVSLSTGDVFGGAVSVYNSDEDLIGEVSASGLSTKRIDFVFPGAGTYLISFYADAVALSTSDITIIEISIDADGNVTFN